MATTVCAWTEIIIMLNPQKFNHCTDKAKTVLIIAQH